MTLTRAKALLAWCLSVLPEDPPSHDLSGWTHAMREEWDRKRDEIREMIEPEVIGVTGPGGIIAFCDNPAGHRQIHAPAVAVPAGGPERAAQLERAGLPLDHEKPRPSCSICLSPYHPATLCEWDFAR